MNDLHSLLHSWSYVIVSYMLVCLCCTILAVTAFIRFRRSQNRLRSIEQSLGAQSDDEAEFSLITRGEVS